MQLALASSFDYEFMIISCTPIPIYVFPFDGYHHTKLPTMPPTEREREREASGDEVEENDMQAIREAIF